MGRKGNLRLILSMIVVGCFLLGGSMVAMGEKMEEPVLLETLLTTSTPMPQLEKQIGDIKRIKSFTALEKLFKDKGIIRLEKDKKTWITEDIVISESMSDTGRNESATTSMVSRNEFSTTNVQVANVDEADVLKTDGRYIYARVDTGTIAIVDTEGQLETVSTITPETKELQVKYEELFVDGNQLIVIGRAYRESELATDEVDQNEQFMYDCVMPYGGGYDTAYVAVYDMKNHQSPKLLREIEIEGDLIEVRKIEDRVYIVTNKYNYDLYEGQYKEEDIVPQYRDSGFGGKMTGVAMSDIAYCEWSSCSVYTVIGSFSIKDQRAIDFEVLLDEGSSLYMNEQALYLVQHIWAGGYGNSLSQITKYNVVDGKLELTNVAKVPGYILNQFAMDEYRGNFRIATQDGSSSGVYVLDQSLQVIGKVEGLAEGEDLYSVRFQGDRGYVVTFEQIDPLFVIDLSVPTNPKVLGELKVPGFSQYLHLIGENLVVGIGRSTVENYWRDEEGKEEFIGVSAAGVKLSLFDVSNPMMPKEINHIILGVQGSYSEALNNHKAVMVDAKNQVLAIPISLCYQDGSTFEGAYVFGIEAGKLVGKAKLGQVLEEQERLMRGTMNRVCYIGDKMYYVYNNKINAYEIKTLRRLETMKLLNVELPDEVEIYDVWYD